MPAQTPEWLKLYQETQAARRGLPAGLPVVVSNHAMARGKTRGGLEPEAILAQLRSGATKVIQAGQGRWVAFLTQGLEAVISLRNGTLVVVTVTPGGPLGQPN